MLHELDRDSMAGGRPDGQTAPVRHAYWPDGAPCGKLDGGKWARPRRTLLRLEVSK